jgi:hypothetical protein
MEEEEQRVDGLGNTKLSTLGLGEERFQLIFELIELCRGEAAQGGERYHV